MMSAVTKPPLVNMKERPDCYQCVHRRSIPGDAHSSCANVEAHFSAHANGVRNGWFMWPMSFDPVWLLACDGFEKKAET